MELSTYQFNIGEYRGYVLFDFVHEHTAEELIAYPGGEKLERIAQDHNFRLDNIPVGYNILLFELHGRYLLVDAGLQKSFGNLHSGLEALKFSPADIDTIVITHADRDHIWGIFDETGEFAFPNASYILLEDSWPYWSSEAGREELTRLNKWTPEKTQFAWETYSKIADSIQFVKSGEEFLPGLRLYPAPGHRIDHSILRVSSAAEQLIHIADAVAHPLFMGGPQWYSTYDADPQQAVETKINLLNLCAAEKALVFASHFPFPGLGYVLPEENRWRWQPLAGA